MSTFLLPVWRRALPLAGALLHAARASPVRFRAVVDARAPPADRQALSVALPDASAADFSRAEELSAALDGCAGLVLAAGDSPRDVLAEDPFVRAAAAVQSLQRVVRVSGPSALVGPAAPTALCRAHWRIERALREDVALGGRSAGCSVHVARAASSMQLLLEGRTREMICGRTLSSPVRSGRVALLHPEDLADAVVGLATGRLAAPVEEEGERWSVYSLTGPEALTFQEICETLSTAVSERVRFSPFPLWAVQPALWIKGVPADQIADEVALAKAREVGLEQDVTAAVSDLAGHPARSLLAFARAHKDEWPRAELH